MKLRATCLLHFRLSWRPGGEHAFSARQGLAYIVLRLR